MKGSRAAIDDGVGLGRLQPNKGNEDFLGNAVAGDWHYFNCEAFEGVIPLPAPKCSQIGENRTPFQGLLVKVLVEYPHL